jgi:GrpB-like predicted nucleotidyltransferase (UPF0157 family)
MTLGLERGIVRLVPYDREWPDLFAREAQRLQAIFAAARLPLRLEHMGSTAVPGLTAKPIIDILGGYTESASVGDYVEVLISAGYIHRGEQGIPGREFFRRGDPRSHHLHLTRIDGAFWRDHLAFRNRLRADDALRDAYASLKQELAARFPRDREAYIEAKGPFVRDVLAAAWTAARCPCAIGHAHSDLTLSDSPDH